LDVIQVAVEIDAECVRQMKISDVKLQPFGLSFFNYPPTDVFRSIAHEHMAAAALRFVNIMLMARMIWNQHAYEQAGILLNNLKTTEDKATREAWIDFQRTTSRTVRTIANSILSSVEFYVNPNDHESPLSITSVGPLVWPLSAFENYHLITPLQRARAREALYQIGTRAKLPNPMNMVKRFKNDQCIFYEMHMLFLA
jgi:hypothetical protein